MPSREFLVPQSIRLLEGEPMGTDWRDRQSLLIFFMTSRRGAQVGVWHSIAQHRTASCVPNPFV